MAGEAIRSLTAEVMFDIDDGPLSRLNRLMDELRDSILGSGVARLEREMADTDHAAVGMGNAIRSASSETKGLDKSAKGAAQGTSRFAEASQRAAKESGRLGTEAGRSSNELDRQGATARASSSAIVSAYRRVNSSTGSALRNLNNYTNGFKRLRTTANGAISSVNRGMLSLGRSVLRAPFGFGGAVAGTAALYGGVLNPLKIASQFEQAQIAFSAMLKSEAKGQQFVDQLAEFAQHTPFDTVGIEDNAKKLLAFGFSQNQVLPMLTGIGNAASGLSLGQEGIDRITLALGQMKAKGRVQGDEMMQITEAGISGWDILSKKMGVSTAEVMKLSEKGLIPANKAIDMLIEGMNEQFPNMMKKQSGSLLGLYNQIKETFSNQIVRNWGEGLSDALKPRFARLSDWIDDNGDKIKVWGETLRRTAQQGMDWVLRKFEGTFQFIDSHYLSNPKFQKLPFNEKIDTVFADIKKKFDAWYDGDGKKAIQDGAKKFVTFTTGTISDNMSEITSIGLDVGKSLASGMLSGFKNFAAENPEMAAIAAFLFTKGPIQLRLAAAAAAATAPEISDVVTTIKDKNIPIWQKSLESIRIIASGGGQLKTDQPDLHPFMPSRKNDGEKGGPYSYQSPADRLQTANKSPIIDRSPRLKIDSPVIKLDGSHAAGLARVPFDGYVAELHKGERIMTAAENRRYSQGDTVTHYGNQTNAPTINVYIEGGTAASQRSIKEDAYVGASRGMDAYWRSMIRKSPQVREV